MQVRQCLYCLFNDGVNTLTGIHLQSVLVLHTSEGQKMCFLWLTEGKCLAGIIRFKLELCLQAQQINAQIIHLSNPRFKSASHVGLNQVALKLKGVLL